MTTETAGRPVCSGTSYSPALTPRTLLGSVGTWGNTALGYLYLTRRRASGRAPAVGASQLTRSRASVRRTRQPSRNVCRFDWPEMRDSSWLGTSAIRRPGPGGPHDQFRFDLEAVRLQFQDVNAFAAEGDVAVAKV